MGAKVLGYRKSLNPLSVMAGRKRILEFDIVVFLWKMRFFIFLSEENFMLASLEPLTCWRDFFKLR